MSSGSKGTRAAGGGAAKKQEIKPKEEIKPIHDYVKLANLRDEVLDDVGSAAYNAGISALFDPKIRTKRVDSGYNSEEVADTFVISGEGVPYQSILMDADFTNGYLDVRIEGDYFSLENKKWNRKSYDFQKRAFDVYEKKGVRNIYSEIPIYGFDEMARIGYSMFTSTAESLSGTVKWMKPIVDDYKKKHPKKGTIPMNLFIGKDRSVSGEFKGDIFSIDGVFKMNDKNQLMKTKSYLEKKSKE